MTTRDITPESADLKCPMCFEKFQTGSDVYFHVQKVHRGNKRIIMDSQPKASPKKSSETTPK